MNSMVIYSDPHIGKMLLSNTTPDSRKRLQRFILQSTCTIADKFEDVPLFCGGDFFDKYQNPEEVLHDSFWMADKTRKILAGNHDVVNIRDKKGTLDILDSVFERKIVPCRFGMSYYEVVADNLLFRGSPGIFMVPHHSTQALFEQALESARAEAASYSCPCILITHCNYDSEFVKDDVTLNMSQRRAADLLSGFDTIYLGHEHNHRTDLDDRVVVIGSPHPTGFGDISDKYIVVIDQQGPSLEPWWQKDRYYLEVDHSELLSKLTNDHQFVRITGSILPAELHELTSNIGKVWKNFNPFAVKSEVQIVTGSTEETRFTGMSPERLQAIVREELKDSPALLEIWDEVTKGENNVEAH